MPNQAIPEKERMEAEGIREKIRDIQGCPEPVCQWQTPAGSCWTSPDGNDSRCFSSCPLPGILCGVQGQETQQRRRHQVLEPHLVRTGPARVDNKESGTALPDKPLDRIPPGRMDLSADEEDISKVGEGIREKPVRILV